MKTYLSIIFALLFAVALSAQNAKISGTVTSKGESVSFATMNIVGTSVGTVTDSLGFYRIEGLKIGKYKLKASFVGYQQIIKEITVGTKNQSIVLDFDLKETDNTLNDVVITGTLKEVRRIESPVPVEVYSPSFFKKNPTCSIFDGLANVNGVRPQLNCNVCNTGDIHINGLEGPYTMILIDGMPIVSSLSTVYGLSGIPNSLVERIEIVKGPASSLYGSEAVGGLINVITKNPSKAPRLSLDLMSTSWLETNLDVGFKMKVGEKADVLTGVNYFNFDKIFDQNNDNFTDMTLQKRLSIFQKWNLKRKDDRVFSLAGRYLHEDRWGGDVRWTKEFRGGDSLYGESIYTDRWELLGNYQLPTEEKLMLSFSYNDHNQNSRYGKTVYDAVQRVAFSQLTWDKTLQNHDLLAGAAFRYTFYEDSTPATATPSVVLLPGIFLQDEITINENHKLLLGARYDYNSVHKNIFTPRIAYKWSLNPRNIIRLNAGTGFRVVNIFTEDHAALQGAREVEVKNELNPEKSYNINLNYIKKIHFKDDSFMGLEFSSWYTHFNNKIIADYDKDPNKIIYDNLRGFAESAGITANADYTFTNGLKILAGVTLMDVTTTNDGIKSQQILTENYTGTWSISYKIEKIDLNIDYTGNIYGPMRLPILGPTDPRRATSPWWSIQNIQLLYSGFKNFEIYGGVKNLLDFLPTRGNPFIIARSNDPFDKRVQLAANGQVLVTPDNPYGLTFDANYLYAPNQGIRGFLGIRYGLK